jgi:methylated-DNA-[protein]-cysteine S-methyltransferase
MGGYSRIMTTGPFLIRVPSPIGRLELTSDADSILTLSIERDGHLPHDEQPENPSPVLEEAARQLEEYFGGTRKAFDLPVQPAGGSAFQRSVWLRLASLGFGEFISYGALGVEVGKPGSARAIGGAVGANPVPIIIGCHRVLASNGRITGYSGGEGIPTKVWLLAHEGIEHVEPKQRSRATVVAGEDEALFEEAALQAEAEAESASDTGRKSDRELEFSGSTALQREV